jgi:predicted cupin superfamily sugar epimerase
VVVPGFDFEDFKLFTKEELLKDYPEHEEIITRLTIK